MFLILPSPKTTSYLGEWMCAHWSISYYIMPSLPSPQRLLIDCNGATFPSRSRPLAVLQVWPKAPGWWIGIYMLGLCPFSTELSIDIQINAQGSSGDSTHSCWGFNMFFMLKFFSSPFKVQGLALLSVECKLGRVSFFSFRLYSFMSYFFIAKQCLKSISWCFESCTYMEWLNQAKLYIFLPYIVMLLFL